MKQRSLERKSSKASVSDILLLNSDFSSLSDILAIKKLETIADIQKGIREGAFDAIFATVKGIWTVVSDPKEFAIGLFNAGKNFSEMGG